MEPAMKILVDLNILLDVLGRREPHYDSSAEVWGAVERGEAEGLIAAHSITTLHYLAGRNVDRLSADNVVQDCLKVFSVAAVDQNVIQEAIGFQWSDFEDAVQMAAASQCNADYLVTRNPKDFEGAPISVLQPGEFIALLNAPSA
jgi:predicted nucleic acid-binding protein